MRITVSTGYQQDATIIIVDEEHTDYDDSNITVANDEVWGDD